MIGTCAGTGQGWAPFKPIKLSVRPSLERFQSRLVQEALVFINILCTAVILLQSVSYSSMSSSSVCSRASVLLGWF